jgi:hypothetical protein
LKKITKEGEINMDSSIFGIVILAVAVIFIATFALLQCEKRENEKDRAPKQEDNPTIPEAPASAEPDKAPEKPKNSDAKRMILPLAVCILGAGAVNGAIKGLGYTLGGLGAMLLYLCAGLIAYIWTTKK